MPHKRHRKAGDLHQLRKVVWGMVVEVEQLLSGEPPPERVLRTAHALSQLSGAYVNLCRNTELEERLAAVEHALQQILQPRNGHDVT
jgi:hypothetical protein